MMSWAKIKGVFILTRRNVARVIAALADAILTLYLLSPQGPLQ
jgi:hypothetical protein